ncbi:MAG: hypothetical protein PHY78_02580 [Desulfobacterales bacterium]|nr:hypothetical protein [Desulfobacterales bacterium]MDD4393954.1 hypothetical protein [Desulfobacterales bacterium]
MGVSVISAMDVVELPSEGLGNRVYMDWHAWNSDGVIVINRVKAHTDFRAPHESGLVKRCAGGGPHGKRHQRHRNGPEYYR